MVSSRKNNETMIPLTGSVILEKDTRCEGNVFVRPHASEETAILSQRQGILVVWNSLTGSGSASAIFCIRSQTILQGLQGIEGILDSLSFTVIIGGSFK